MTKATAARLGKILRSLVLEGFAPTIVDDHVQVYVCVGCTTRHPHLGSSQVWHLRTLAERDAFLTACEAHTCQSVPVEAPVQAPVAVLDVKVVKCARLAISAEGIDSLHEALQAARTCGTLAAKAGHTLDEVWVGLAQYGLPQASATWHAIVDAHYSAR